MLQYVKLVKLNGYLLGTTYNEIQKSGFISSPVYALNKVANRDGIVSIGRMMRIPAVFNPKKIIEIPLISPTASSFVRRPYVGLISTLQNIAGHRILVRHSLSIEGKIVTNRISRSFFQRMIDYAKLNYYKLDSIVNLLLQDLIEYYRE